MNLNIPFTVDVKAKAASSFTPENIAARLATLAERTDASARDEREFLLRLKHKKGW